MEVSFDVGLPSANEATSNRREVNGNDSSSSAPHDTESHPGRSQEVDILLSELLRHVRAERWDDLIQLLIESQPASSSALILPVGVDTRGNIELDASDDDNGDNNDSDSDSSGSAPVNAVGNLLHVACVYPLVPLEVCETIVRIGGPNLCRQTYTHSMLQTPLHLIVQQCPERCDLVELLVTASPKIVNQRDVQYYLPIEILCQTIIMKEERIKYTNNVQRRAQLSTELESLWNCAHILANAAASLSSSTKTPTPLSDPIVEFGTSTNLKHEQQQSESPPDITVEDPHQSSQRCPPRLPMVHACLRATNFPFALAERAIKRYPEQLRQQDRFGDLPLHVVAGRSPPSMSAAASTTTATTAATSRFGREDDDDDGEENTDDEEEESDDEDDDDEDDFLDQLITMYPEAASTWSRSGQIPLTVAINSGRRWNSGIARLLEAHPAGIEDQGLPLEYYSLVYAQVVRHNHMSILYGMLRAKPELFQS